MEPILVDCFSRGLQEDLDGTKFILGLNGESDFELKFVNGGSVLRISDGGRTLRTSTQTKRKIKNVLKNFAPVTLDGEEISITLDNPYATLMALLTLYSAVYAVKKMK